MSKRIRIYDADELASHASSSSCWVSYKGKVFDVTRFLPDHPGGDDIMLKYAGQDVEKVMKDESEHDHSESAYDILVSNKGYKKPAQALQDIGFSSDPDYATKLIKIIETYDLTKYDTWLAL